MKLTRITCDPNVRGSTFWNDMGYRPPYILDSRLRGNDRRGAMRAFASSNNQRFSTDLRSSRQELRNSSGDRSRRKTRPRVARIRALP